MGLDLDRILQLAQEMDDAPPISAQQAEQLARLFSSPPANKSERRSA